MASSSRSRSRTRKQYRKGNKACSGSGGSSKRRSRSRTDKKKRKTHKWSQKGCQSGGSNLVGTGSAWHPSGTEHQTAGSASASAYATNSGNHFSLNTNTLAPPQSSNHLVEKGILAGGRKRGSRRHGRGRKHRRFIGEQRGGMIHLLPETVKPEINNATQMPASAVNVIQGAATPVASADPTIQPIGQPLLHRM